VLCLNLRLHPTNLTWWNIVDSLNATDYIKMQNDSVYFYGLDFFTDSITEYAISKNLIPNMKIARLFEGYYIRVRDTLCNGEWTCNMEGSLLPCDSAEIKLLTNKIIKL
jgi:hypothetical protein